MRVVVLTVVPQVARSYTEIVRAAGHEVPAVIVPRSSPFAKEHVEENPPDLDVLFADAKSSLPRLLGAYDPDVGLCTGFPWLITQEALEVPRLGIVNGHPSLLPRYRGPFPLAWAVRNGETEVGMTYHFMDAAFDTGNILVQEPLPLDPDETWETIVVKLAAASAELLPRVLRRLEAGETGEPQEGPGEYQSRFEEEYAVIDPSRTAAETHVQVRAWGFVPPFARFGPILERNGRRIRVQRTSLSEVEGAERLDCADGPLWLVESVPLQMVDR
jgi:methionyl-tRNA formyltransferase